ncbi:MAG: hypothetical protein DRJ51_06120 [Thermoprotei archaeon]|nr:MAG: hypothetical protein DRJ51_06120 [Thermoprotei archaeon]
MLANMPKVSNTSIIVKLILSASPGYLKYSGPCVIASSKGKVTSVLKRAKKVTIYGLEVEEEAWQKRAEIESKILARVFKDLDLSGLRILDGGTGVGYAVRYLVSHVGNGVVVTVDIDPRCLEMLRNFVNGNLLKRIIFIKADLRKLAFIKDGYFDLVNLYFTLHTVESTTPGGTIQVLREMYRLLRPGGMLVVTENYSEFTPIDKAQEVFLELSMIESSILDALGVHARDVEYSPEELVEMLTRIGFRNMSYKEVSRGELDPTLKDWVAYLVKNAKKIRDDRVRENILEEISVKLKEVEIYGLRDGPSYALYAFKP